MFTLSGEVSATLLVASPAEHLGVVATLTHKHVLVILKWTMKRRCHHNPDAYYLISILVVQISVEYETRCTQSEGDMKLFQGVFLLGWPSFTFVTWYCNYNWDKHINFEKLCNIYELNFVPKVLNISPRKPITQSLKYWQSFQCLLHLEQVKLVNLWTQYKINKISICISTFYLCI